MTPLGSTLQNAVVLPRMLIMGVLCCGPVSSIGTLYFESQSAALHGLSDVLFLIGAEAPMHDKPQPAESSAVSVCTMAGSRSPDAYMRLRELEAWAQQGSGGSHDVLKRALDDPDEHVRARALQLIEEDWVRELEELNKRQ